MGKGKRLNITTAILKINAGCSIFISNCAKNAGQGQRGAENRVQERRLQELRQKKNVSSSVHFRSASWKQDTGTVRLPEPKRGTSSSQGSLTNSQTHENSHVTAKQQMHDHHLRGKRQ